MKNSLGTLTYSTYGSQYEEGGTEVTHRIRALQTPLQLVTVGSGYKLRTQTCPTYPSLLHTHTSFIDPIVEAAHVNCSPARVLRMGIIDRNSGATFFSYDVAKRRIFDKSKAYHQYIVQLAKVTHSIYSPNFCLAIEKASSHWFRFSGFENSIDMFWLLE